MEARSFCFLLKRQLELWGGFFSFSLSLFSVANIKVTWEQVQSHKAFYTIRRQLWFPRYLPGCIMSSWKMQAKGLMPGEGESASEYLSVNLGHTTMLSCVIPLNIGKCVLYPGYKFSTKLFSKDYKGNAEAQQFSLPLALGCCAIGWACARQQNGEWSSAGQQNSCERERSLTMRPQRAGLNFSPSQWTSARSSAWKCFSLLQSTVHARKATAGPVPPLATDEDTFPCIHLQS